MHRFARRFAVLALSCSVITVALADAGSAEAQRRRRPSGRARDAQTQAQEQQREGVDPRLDEEARQLFLAGQTAYDAGRYEAALDYFTRAHALSGRPGLLFNIASASERLRRDDEALRAYEEYLRVMPDASNREFAEQRIAFLREQIAADARLRQAAQRADGGDVQIQAREDEERAPSGAARATTTPRPAEPRPIGEPAVAPGALAVDTDTDDRDGDVTGEWWFWTLVGVAVVGTGVGVGVAIAAATDGDSGPPVQGDFGPGGVIVALEAF
ncbi:tetratricopeptide repeat protein [Sandaracinus amylolyticus]|uniref:tetratricopeptide repeat protein n=1 Tax=Sandaracinus amylolyticus TaxID=927083 RepID=UPI001F35D006|nr:hypothetical protein [Sandaracinus amylolyticus]UJR81862.1 Hypothetical protein I5071_39270 [Sandaracinus amylolyticus]